MNNLLAYKKIDSFETILCALKSNGFVFRDMVDGGAGWGETSDSMIKYGTESSRCFAFEPFPGNHIFFDSRDSRVRLCKVALGNRNTKSKFFVPSVVKSDSEWGSRGLTGYSSVGSLDGNSPDSWKVKSFLKSILRSVRYRKSNANVIVDVQRGDEALKAVDANVDFMKLDLQGGELNALKGMDQLLTSLPFMWIEFIGNKYLLDYIISKDFHLFDTSYLFIGNPTPLVKDLFDISREGVILSTGQTAYFAFKRCGWSNYYEEFIEFQKNSSLVQTDILCVKSQYLDLFYRSLL